LIGWFEDSSIGIVVMFIGAAILIATIWWRVSETSKIDRINQSNEIEGYASKSYRVDSGDSAQNIDPARIKDAHIFDPNKSKEYTSKTLKKCSETMNGASRRR
jgi:hypothetical protein